MTGGARTGTQQRYNTTTQKAAACDTGRRCMHRAPPAGVPRVPPPTGHP
ncbi:hypothetical protein C7S14_1181 [Burkholderia cepacia]|nr:hypothetical protein C7S14_1181 [Burkholderia cepacia]